MSTKFNLNIDSHTDGMETGADGATQNTTIRSEDPNELIAILRKLAGMTGADSEEHTEHPAHADHAAPAVMSSPADAMRAMMQKSGEGSLPASAVVAVEKETPCGCESEEQVDEALANAPNPKTMKSLLDIVNTDHTARAPTKPVPAKSGDNPLADSEDLMESRLMREWQETKIQHYASELNHDVAVRAILEGKASFVDGTREYAVRTQEGFIKVYPVLENRVMTQAPVYVVQEGFSQALSRDDRFTPDRLKVLDRPAIQRSGDMNKPVPHKLEEPKFDRTGRRIPRKIGETEENGETMTDVFNRYKRHFAIMHDRTEERDQRDLSSRECKDIIVDLQAKHPDEFNLVRDLKLYAQYQERFDHTQDLRYQTNASRLLSKYEDLNSAAPAKPVDPQNAETELTEAKKKTAKKKAKNKYAIGMAAAMKSTGDKPPLKKSTITKAHKIADKIKEGSKKK